MRCGGSFIATGGTSTCRNMSYRGAAYASVSRLIPLAEALDCDCDLSHLPDEIVEVEGKSYADTPGEAFCAAAAQVGYGVPQ